MSERLGPAGSASADVGGLPDDPIVVGIGASAGGLDAITRVVRHLPANAGLAYVVVQHLDPAHESLLAEILGRAMVVPVVVATDGARLERDHAYVIPSGAEMTVDDGHLRITKRERARGAPSVIDSFLVSLSHAHGSDAVGVILSGAGSDGALGIEAIKEAGGITIAQDAASAQFASMPERAIGTGCVDFVLPPERIAEQLADIGRRTVGRVTDDAGARARDEADVQAILLLLRERSGVDFRHYRRATVDRRILRRMLAHKSDTRGEYLTRVREHPEELDALYDDLLIGVTRFFRDPETFEALQRTAIPKLVAERRGGTPLRVWVAGCSGGEETYSIAMVLLEYIEGCSADVELQIFATDLNDSAIARARAGLYPPSIEADVSPERLQRFFVPEEGGYRIARRVRDLCVFSRHNVFRDPPFSQLDLISCRNVLIYFDATLQQGVMPVFHYALRPNGVLLIGTAESASPDYFVALDKQHRIFASRANVRRSFDNTGIPSAAAIGVARTPPAPRARERSMTETLQQDADRAVVSRFGSLGVVVNDQLEITQLRGDTSGLLQLPAGTASLQLLKLATAELRRPLRAALERAAEGVASHEDDIVVSDGDAARRFSVQVLPFRSGPDNAQYFLVLFEEQAAASLPHAEGRQATKLAKRATRRGQRGDAATEDRMDHLRHELAEARRHLQEVIEQYETANEELRAANEEIESANEELQSTNEELETTKEEVQSTNEELTTVNDELRQRNRDLSAVSSDLANVFANTQVPILIVDTAMRIRRFTPVTERVLRIIPTDVGRPLGDVKLRVDIPDLEARVAETIATLNVAHEEARDDQGRWWSLTIRPYLTVDRTVDGAVVVFSDIDASKKFGATAAETSENRRLLLIDAESARAEAVEANMVKAQFLASVSHELRTPLNAIAGYIDLLELGIHGPLKPPQHDDLMRIKRNARHLISLINDILNFARIDAGHLDFRITAVPVDAVIAILGEMVDPQLRAKGLRLTVTSCDASVRADEEKLSQILLNLVTNAIKFTDAGSISVSCREDETVIHFDVTDTGRGIAEPDQQRIFEPFVQVDRRLTSVGAEGVGLGLAISRDLARRMGGDLTVSSTVNVGSTFSLTLPRDGSPDLRA